MVFVCGHAPRFVFGFPLTALFIDPSPVAHTHNRFRQTHSPHFMPCLGHAQLSRTHDRFRSGWPTHSSHLLPCLGHPQSSCTHDRFQKWPADALEAVAMKFLAEMDVDLAMRKQLVALCQAIHVKVTEASEGEYALWSQNPEP